jgi:hypothetical protein
VVNTSNYPGKDNPHWPPAQAPRPRPAAVALVMERRDGRSARARLRDALTLAAGVALDWLAYFLRRGGDRRFAMNDTEAYWRGWQITKTLAGLGRRYRDIRFGTLAACARCAGAGVWADAPCGPCLGTGRITPGQMG